MLTNQFVICYELLFDSAGKGLENVGKNNRPIISSDGKVFLMLPTIINFACLMDVKFFPFDRQSCSVKVTMATLGS